MATVPGTVPGIVRSSQGDKGEIAKHRKELDELHDRLKAVRGEAIQDTRKLSTCWDISRNIYMYLVTCRCFLFFPTPSCRCFGKKTCDVQLKAVVLRHADVDVGVFLLASHRPRRLSGTAIWLPSNCSMLIFGAWGGPRSRRDGCLFCVDAEEAHRYGTSSPCWG